VRRRLLIALVAMIALMLSLAPGTSASSPVPLDTDLGTLDLPVAVTPFGGRLAPALEALTEQSLVEASLGTEIWNTEDVRGGKVLVAIYRDERAQLAGTSSLEAAGLTVDKVRGGVVQGWAPIERLAEIAQMRGVRLVRPPLYAQPSELSEGTAIINSGMWNAAGMTGWDTAVAIVDTSFDGYATLLGTDLPDSVELHASRSDWLIQAGSVHGTACAEVVHDVAPGTTLHLISIATDIDLQDAVAYVRGMGIDIVSCSVGWPIGGPGDGTGPIANTVGAATLDDILWVQAAGNEAHRHWIGPWRDSDDDGWGEDASGAELNQIYVPETTDVAISMRWDETWEEAQHEFALWVYNTSMIPVAYATTSATAPGDPTRQVSLPDLPWGYYYIAFEKTDSAPFDGQVEIFSYPYGLNGAVSTERSIAVPGDMVDVLTVGAVPWMSPFEIEYYSSGGPTTDGRLKPDLVAPDQVSSVSYAGQPEGFAGTSAAAPHAAGAAAILKAMYPEFAREQLTDWLIGNALDAGDPGPDMRFGHGLLNMGQPPATPTPTSTATPTSTMYASPEPSETVTTTPTSTPSRTPTPTGTLGPVRCVLPLLFKDWTATSWPTATVTAPATIPPPTTIPPTVPVSPTATVTPTATASATTTPTATETATASATVTVTPSATSSVTATATRTPTATPTATEPATGCWEEIANGGFEDDSIWVKSPGARPPVFTTDEQHSDLRSCRLGIAPPTSDFAGTSSVLQTFGIPTDTITATLSFWAWRGSEEPGATGQAFGQALEGISLQDLVYDDDVQEVLLFSRGNPGDPWLLLAELERNKETNATWEESVYDLSAHAGLEIMLYINVYNDGTDGRTWMYVDDVSVELCR